MERNIYKEKGYKNRKDYLESLALEMDVPYDAVLVTAQMLGPGEDFDGLVSCLEDFTWDE